MIKFDSVTKRYNQHIIALENVCFELDQGDFCYITGPSGAGKSTILKLLIKEETPTSGNIFYEDIEVPKIPHTMLPSYRQKLGVVFQDMKLLDTRTLEENIAFALEILNTQPLKIKDTTDYLLELVNLEDRRNLLPTQLSGGEQQRGAIARALASNPSLFIADEPTGNLDKDNSLMILDILKKINQSGTTVIVITHDMGLVDTSNGSSRKIHLEKGKVASDSQPQKKKSPKPTVKKVKKNTKTKMDSQLSSLSKGLVAKLEKSAIYSNEILLSLTQKDLKTLKLSRKEGKELEKYIKNYLSKKQNETKGN
ncbi:ATP-binding cassette domain-containing protein [bacterium]|nr:ATP-binding cassette domain-containing protein [bacterium]